MLFLGFTMPNVPVQARQQISASQYEAWLDGVAAGDTAAFEALYRATDRIIFAFALSLTGNREDAQDIMMDTYVKIRTGAHLYTSQGKPLAWIFTIARNLVRSRQRETHRQTPMESVEKTTRTIEDFESTLVLREALRVLGEQEREIVLLHAVSGMKHRELAAALGLPLATVLSKYARALRKLKRELIEGGQIK